jgi:short-subunit dehydrogenase
MIEFKNKTALVTGATSGIGRAIAIQLKKAGANLILFGRDFSKLNGELAENKTCKHYHLDFRDHRQIIDTISTMKRENCKIDFLIHSAGIISIGDMIDSNISTLDDQYYVNCRAPYLITQQLLSALIRTKGTIVFLNSTAGLKAWEGNGQYSASKFGLRAVADSLRLELADKDVNVVSVYPASTSSPMQEFVQKVRGRAYNPEDFMNADDVAKRIVSAIIPLGKAGVSDLTLRP